MSASPNDPFDRNDDFWDISTLLPQKKRGGVFSSDTDTVEIAVTPTPESRKGEPIPPPPSDRLRLAKEALKKAEQKHHDYVAAAFGDRKASDTRSTHDRSERAPAAQDGEASPTEEVTPSEEPLFSYSPEGNALLQTVTVRLWPSRYSFYERFRTDAQRYLTATAAPCEHVPFFSFTPQYSQLSRDQLNYYLYFRSLLYRGECPKADFSYLLLFIYEIINLPDRIPPEKGLTLLTDLWRAYRNSYPKLDRLLSEWVCDYCLIHRLSPPAALCDGTMEKATESASLREFYVGSDTASPSPYASALFAYASAYSWKNSKFITDDNRALFERHIRGAFLYAFDKAEKEHSAVFVPLGEKAMTPVRTVRDAFNGALCAYNVKRRLEIRYLSCSRSVELRYTVTDVIKFAENQVRSLLGIRSRFHTPNLALPLRQAVEEYFAPLKKAKKKDAPQAEPPAYEALYEPAHEALSLSLAKDMEEKAWATTELLTEELPDEDLPEAPPNALSPSEPYPVPSPAAPIPDDGEKAFFIEALTHCLHRDHRAFAALAATRHLLPDALAEAINEHLYDVVGDVVLEEGEDGYHLVTDYLEEITEWMKK